MKNIIEMVITGKNKGVYLVHEADVGFIPLSVITNEDLDKGTLSGFKDILTAEISDRNPNGAYGEEIQLAGISADRLMKFDDFLAKL